MRSRLMTTCMLLLVLCASMAHSEEIVVIVNSQNPSSSLSDKLIGDIYLSRTKRFPTGERAEPLDLPKEMSITNDFYTKVVKKTPAQLQAHWSRLVFTGKGRPPKKLSDQETVKTAVAEKTYMLGYIDKNNADDSVKIMLVIP